MKDVFVTELVIRDVIGLVVLCGQINLCVSVCVTEERVDGEGTEGYHTARVVVW